MATFLDIGILEHFGSIFVILLIFLLVFGLLEYIKAFGPDKKGLHGMIAIIIALLFLISKVAANMVKLMVPWFMVIIIFVFFVMFLIRMFGPGEQDMIALIKNKEVYPWIIIFSVLILFFALGSSLGQTLLEKGEGEESSVSAGTTIEGSGLQTDVPGTTSTSTPSFSTNLLNTLRNPKVLGFIFIFLIGAFALLFLTKATSPPG